MANSIVSKGTFSFSENGFNLYFEDYMTIERTTNKGVSFSRSGNNIILSTTTRNNTYSGITVLFYK